MQQFLKVGSIVDCDAGTVGGALGRPRAVDYKAYESVIVFDVDASRAGFGQRGVAMPEVAGRDLTTRRW